MRGPFKRLDRGIAYPEGTRSSEGAIRSRPTPLRAYLCVEGMVLRAPSGDPDPATGELPMREHAVLPTHYKCPHSGAAMPVESPEVWVYHDELNDPEAP